MSELIETREGKVAVLTLNRPGSLNAFSIAMMRGLIDAFERLGVDEQVGAIMLRGEGRSFCVGGDVKGWAERANWTYEKHHEEMRWKQRLPMVMKSCPKVIVAALHGHVLGAGFSTALGADFRIAAQSTIFGTSFANVGYAGDFGVTSSLLQIVGPAKARELMILNPRLSAAEALELGLVTKVVADEALAEDAASLAKDLADGPYLAWGHIKRNLLIAESEPLATVLEAEATSLARLSITEDHREAIAAFAQKRAPKFKGR